MKKKFWKMLTIIAFVLFCLKIIGPVISHAAENTTIIYLDPNRNYEKGEIVKIRVGISSTDGSYLKSADCGFGYNGATMKLLTRTDTETHFHVESDTPVKWLYYDMEFEMKNDGSMYFIAGAYDGDEVIRAIKADGSVIKLPRASVVKKIGTGIYTNVSDCNLESITAKTNSGVEIEWNRPFDKNITEYWANVDPEIDSISFEGIAENKNDKVIMPDQELKAGENIKNVYIEAEDGVKKKYTFHIIKPEQPLSVKDIIIKDQNGNRIDYTFSEEETEYYLELDNSIEKISFEGKSDFPYVKFDYDPKKDVREGYENFDVTAKTESEEKVYHFNTFRKTPPLRIISLIGELSDSTILKFDQEFDAEIYDYTAKCTSDIRKVKFVYTLADEQEYLKDDATFELDEGVNVCKLTVTDGINEQDYQVTIIKNAYDVTEKKEEPRGPIINNREIQGFIHKNRTYLSIIAGIICIPLLVLSVIQIKNKVSEYQASDEKRLLEEENDRKKRWKEIKKNRKDKKR